MSGYILAVDQSTSGTKALLFDRSGAILQRSDAAHRQIVSEEGFISHDAEEIYINTLKTVRDCVTASGADLSQIKALGISNQRETALVWDRKTGKPVNHAVVWQCVRAAEICKKFEYREDFVRKTTGLNLSPYFSAGKIAWVLQNSGDLSEKELCAGTMDSYLIFRLTSGRSFKTDYSNAARTQLFDIHNLSWSKEICELFSIEEQMLPAVCDSNARFGTTDFEGFLPQPIPIYGVLGDSNGALYGQGCTRPGMVKATYGTGSSVMMNIGDRPVLSEKGLVTSLAWSINGKVQYVLEGNINYTGAVTKWVVEDLHLLESAKEAGHVAASANPEDSTYLVPAFSGLGAPHWNSEARAMIYGMTRNTGRAELVKAAEECIAYQITDIVRVMEQEAGKDIAALRVDGGPTRDRFLMQFQSDLLGTDLLVPRYEELSAIGAAYMAGIACGLYREEILSGGDRQRYRPDMSEEIRDRKYRGWQQAVAMLQKNPNHI